VDRRRPIPALLRDQLRCPCRRKQAGSLVHRFL